MRIESVRLVVSLAFLLVSTYAAAAPATSLAITRNSCAFGLPCPLVPPLIDPQAHEIFGVLVAAVDANGILDESYRGNIVFSSSDPLASLPAPAALDGIGGFSVILNSSGRLRVTASDASGVLPSASVDVDVHRRPTSRALDWSSTPGGGLIRGIAAVSDGPLWFTSTSGGFSGTGFIVRISPNGDRAEFPAAPFPGGIVEGSDGNLWFASAGDGFSVPGKIGRITPDGVVTMFPVAATSAPQDVALGGDGNVWFTDSAARVGRITPAGEITFYGTPGRIPYHIARAPDGSLWFTESTAIARISLDGTITELPLPAGGRAWGIAAAPDGTIWYSKDDSPAIGRTVLSPLEPSGFSLSEYPIAGAGSLAITAGADGAVWFATVSGDLVRATQFRARDLQFEEYSNPIPQDLWALTSDANGRLLAGGGSLERISVSDCPASPNLCLDGRFRATVSRSAAGGASSPAVPVPGTVDSGHFWFFSPNNVELVVKVVDGRAFNGKYWIFAGSLTDVEFELTVTDTLSGAVRTYQNAAGQSVSIADVAAF